MDFFNEDMALFLMGVGRETAEGLAKQVFKFDNKGNLRRSNSEITRKISDVAVVTLNS